MTTTTSPSPANNEVNDMLNQTEIGSFIARYKNPVLGLVVGVIIGVFGYGYYSHMSETKMNDNANALYAYTTQALEDFKADKVKAQDVVNGFKAAYSGKEGFSSAGVFIIQLADELVAKKKMDEAYVLLQLGTETISNTQMLFFLRMRAAAVGEDLGKTEEALAYLENILKGSVMYLSDKVYLDAGRLYNKVGNKEKAISSFKWIIDQGKEEEFKKMARLYLDELGAS